jgi:hypothetical protein
MRSAPKALSDSSPIEEQDFGPLTRLRVPGAGEIGVYQPKPPSAIDLPG